MVLSFSLLYELTISVLYKMTAFLQRKPVHQELPKVACHFICFVAMIFSLRVRSWLLSKQRHCVYVKFRQRTLLNVKLAD